MEEGNAHWVPASRVKGLCPTAATLPGSQANDDIPPPLPQAPPSVPAAYVPPTVPATAEKPSAPLSPFAKLRQKAGEAVSKTKEKWDGLTPETKEVIKTVGVTVAVTAAEVAATAAVKHVLGGHHAASGSGGGTCGTNPEDDSVIQGMKDAGTYTPGGATIAKELMDAAREQDRQDHKLNPTDDPAIQDMIKAGTYTSGAASIIRGLRGAFQKNK